MQVTKYPQSHLLISDGTHKIVIDSGSITFSKDFKAEQFAGADAYLFTHSHPDHLDTEHIQDIVGDKPVFGNADVVKVLGEKGIKATQVNHGQSFQAGGFQVTAIDLPHCKMQDGSDGPPNTGFLINGVLFHPGDGDKAPDDVITTNVALPIAGPTITLDGALQFAKDVQAKVVIPIHNDYFHNDEAQFAQMASASGIEVRILKPGEATEL